MQAQQLKNSLKHKIKNAASSLGISDAYLIFCLVYLNEHKENHSQDLDYEMMLYFNDEALKERKEGYYRDLNHINTKKRRDANDFFRVLSESEYNAIATEWHPAPFCMLNQLEAPMVGEAIIISWAYQEMTSGKEKCKPRSLTQSILSKYNELLQQFAK